MIESLAEHGVLSEDLIPALMTTHTVKNPEYDPVAAKTIREEMDEPESEMTHAEEVEDPQSDVARVQYRTEQELSHRNTLGQEDTSASPFTDPFDQDELTEPPPPPYRSSPLHTEDTKSKKVNPFGDDDDLEEENVVAQRPTPIKTASIRGASNQLVLPDIEEGDIAATFDEPTTKSEDAVPTAAAQQETSPTEASVKLLPKPTNATEVVKQGVREEGPKQSEALPGVSTALSKTDENVTLDIRWTVVSTPWNQFYVVIEINKTLHFSCAISSYN
jgi:hypothetical protein